MQQSGRVLWEKRRKQWLDVNVVSIGKNLWEECLFLFYTCMISYMYVIYYLGTLRLVTQNAELMIGMVDQSLVVLYL
jgi:hypothetical protein